MAKQTKRPPEEKPQAQEQASASQPSGTIDWGSYSAPITGFENLQQSDLGTPFLGIIQPKSPEVDRTHQDYATKRIEGASAGDIINTLTRKVLAKFDEDEVLVVPAAYEKTLVEWKPEAAGGGFVREHRNDAILLEVTGQNEKNQSILRSGNILVDTMKYYVFVIPDDPGEVPIPAVISLTSTQLKHGRKWLNLATGIRLGGAKTPPPLFSHIYALSSVVEKNEKGSWFGWNVEVREVVRDSGLVKLAAETCARVVNLNRPKIAAPAADDVPM